MAAPRSASAAAGAIGAVVATLLATASLAQPAEGRTKECSANPAGISSPYLLQVASVRPAAAQLAGLLAWEAVAESDGPAPLPPKRDMPACTVSPLTQRCLPSFMVIGNQKAGTSSLFNILRTHPQVRTAFKKELLWFNGNFESPRCSPPELRPDDEEFGAYLQQYPAVLPNESRVMGEFSASYMHCWCCPASMRRLMPDLRLMTQLRDPIERARSRWVEQHTWANRVQTYGSFEEYIDRELPGLEQCLKDHEDSLEWRTHCAAFSNILGLSIYDSAIELWLKHFGRENILVTYLEQLAASPQSVASAIHRHLGIEDLQYDETLLHQRFNAKGNYGWQKAPVATIQAGRGDNKTSLERLYRFYRPHMQRLKAMADAGILSPLPSSWVARWVL